jgi:hypothetical protein
VATEIRLRDGCSLELPGPGWVPYSMDYNGGLLAWDASEYYVEIAGFQGRFLPRSEDAEGLD